MFYYITSIQAILFAANTPITDSQNYFQLHKRAVWCKTSKVKIENLRLLLRSAVVLSLQANTWKAAIE